MNLEELQAKLDELTKELEEIQAKLDSEEVEEQEEVKAAQEKHEEISRVLYDNTNRRTYVKPKENIIPDDKKQEILNKLDELDIGSIVRHKKFGIGMITWIDSKRTHIKIKFDSGEKQFIYPDAFFQGHLEFE